MTICALLLSLFLARPSTPPPTTSGWQRDAAVPGGGRAWVYLPKSYGTSPLPLVVALPGWNHTPKTWVAHDDLGALAERYQLVIAIPDAGRTVYETALYPETKTKGLPPEPGATWIGDTVLLWLRQTYTVAQDRAHTAIIGYSTGGRGAVLVAALYPDFAFAGALSGTFDLLALPPKTGEHKIHANIFGARATYPERWRRDDVLTHVARLTDVEVFIGHGGADKVVSSTQSSALSDALGAAGVRHGLRIDEPAGHDWAYWHASWPELFEAMSVVLRRQPIR